MSAVDPFGRNGPERRLRLYVAGDGPNSSMAIATLRRLLEELSAQAIELEIIDVMKDPERALQSGVLVTPLLLKVAPPPERRMLGRLSDRRSLLNLLGLDEALRG